MARALALAERGLYTTTPNPRVGCVIVKDGTVVGEGWHERAGRPHAEVDALADARAQAHDPRGATALRDARTVQPPRPHAALHRRGDRGRNRARGRRDGGSEPAVPAKAPQRLREAGIAVDVGLHGRRSARAEHRLRLAHDARPAVGADEGRGEPRRPHGAANGESQWITGEDARADGHRWRARACAILTGIGTVRQDDPRLTVARSRRRASRGRSSSIVTAKLPAAAKALAGGNALIVTAGARNADWPEGVEVLTLPDATGRVDLDAMLREFGARGINELHVEAGARLNAALLTAGLVDELLLYLAPCVIGDPARGIADFRDGLARLADRVPLTIHAADRVGADLRILARVHSKEA